MTAIICSQDTLANSALIQCQQLGYKVPEDISIIDLMIFRLQHIRLLH